MTITEAPAVETAESAGDRHRAALALGLIEAAAWILDHRELPVPHDVVIHHSISAASDQAGEDELQRIAAMIPAPVTGQAVSTTRLDFGPVRYEASYITRDYMSAHTANSVAFQAAQRVAEIRAGLAADRAARQSGEVA